jgi:hypothetical protein
MTELYLEFKNLKANYESVLLFLDWFFFLFMDFNKGCLGNFRFKNIIKKSLQASAHDDLHAIQVARETPYNSQNPTFIVALEAARRPLSSDVTRTHRGGSFGLW